MGRRKKRPAALPVFCYYCDREFVNEQVLIEHQKAKHFRCEHCERVFVGIQGLSHHMRAVHSEELKKVANALPQRNIITYNIYGMQNIPKDVWDMKMAALLPPPDKDADQKSYPNNVSSNSSGQMNAPGALATPVALPSPPPIQAMHTYYAQPGYYYHPGHTNYGMFPDQAYYASPSVLHTTTSIPPQQHHALVLPPPPPPPALSTLLTQQAEIALSESSRQQLKGVSNLIHSSPSSVAAVLGQTANSAVVTSAPSPPIGYRTHETEVSRTTLADSLQSSARPPMGLADEIILSGANEGAQTPSEIKRDKIEIPPTDSQITKQNITVTERLLYRSELSMEELRAQHLSRAFGVRSD